MVSGRRVLAETKRELTRGTGPWTLVGGLALASLFALFALGEVGTDGYVAATYLFVPMLLCPLAAQRVASDRENGVTAISATTPLGRAEFLLGKLIALALLLVAGLALTLPILYALTEPIAPGAFAAAVPLVGWGLLLGLISLLVGLVIGYTKQGPSTGALSIGFGLVIAWFFVAAQRDRFLAWADGETELAVIQAILHANPMTWALEAKSPGTVGVAANHAEIAVGLAVLLLPLLIGLGALALGLQNLDGWLEAPGDHPVAVALLAAAVLGAGGLLATWDYTQPAPRPDVPSGARLGQAGDLHVALRVHQDGPWHAKTPLVIELLIAGPPNATVTIDHLELTGPDVTVRHEAGIPATLTLDEIRDGSGRYVPENETYGTGELTAAATATPHRITALIAFTAEVTVDGNEMTLATQVAAFDWQAPIAPSLAAASVPLALLTLTALIAPRRLNRW